MGKIILLNGCSSSGKTTLALKLQQMLPQPYQHVALDQFRDGMPGRVRGLNAPADTEGSLGLNVVPGRHGDEWVTQIQLGSYGERVLKAMRRTVAALNELDVSVIVDDLLFKPEYLHDYVSVLDPDSVWFIGVRCDLNVVSAREAIRPGRFPGTATAHYKQVHAHGEMYDLDVDTTHASPRQNAAEIIARLQQPPQAFAKIRQRLATQS
jgi:chloramphenicol 3-O phosphotransferase